MLFESCFDWWVIVCYLHTLLRASCLLLRLIAMRLYLLVSYPNNERDIDKVLF